jgi:hypothetical protein
VRLAALLVRCATIGVEVDRDGTVSSRDAARLLGVTEQSLRADRCYFGRVPFIRRGRLVRYRLVDLVEFVDGL